MPGDINVKQLVHHFSDEPTIAEDHELGDILSSAIGDTFIHSISQSPLNQWTQIAKALRIHGLKLTSE